MHQIRRKATNRDGKYGAHVGDLARHVLHVRTLGSNPASIVGKLSVYAIHNEKIKKNSAKKQLNMEKPKAVRD
jgi:hypothetical protein